MKNNQSKNQKHVLLNSVEIQSEDCRPIACTATIGGNLKPTETMDQDQILSSVLQEMTDSEKQQLFLSILFAEEAGNEQKAA